MLRYIEIPYYMKDGIKSINTSFYKNDINLISGDIETKPYQLLGLKNKDEFIIEDIQDEEMRLKVFLKKLYSLTDKDRCNVLFFHNLKFDLQFLFLKHKEIFRNYTFTLRFNKDYELDEKGKIKIVVFSKNVWFAKIHFEKNKRVFVIDSYAFFKAGLGKITKSFNFKYQKYKYDFDNNLSKKELITYLENDLNIQEELSHEIIDFHKDFDIRISVSKAQLSARIFKKKFMREGDKLPMPNQFIDGIIKSYHGGKNGFYFDKVTKIENVNVYDVNSMYPQAMMQLPNFNNCSFDYIDYLDNEREGVYKVYGHLKKCKYPIFYTHDFKPLKEDMYINGLWITSYELKEAIRNNEFELKECIGVVVNEHSDYNPISEFVSYFYEKKNTTPKDNPKYNFFKEILNSLYGKFIQNHVEKRMVYYNPETDSFTYSEVKGRAGGLFNPLIATLITGYSRAYMHKLEHDYQSLHTATDSILTLNEAQDSKVIGELHLEAKGKIILFRNKCYIMFLDEPIIKEDELCYFKYANHGFYSNIGDLLKLYLNKENKYTYKRMGNIRESLSRVNKEIKPCEFNEFESDFNVKW